MKMKRKAIMLLTTMAAVLVIGSGVALAATTIHCPNAPGGSPTTFIYCYGTTGADTMSGSDLIDYMLGKGGNDTMHGYGGNDFYLEGGNGSDHLYGDAGGDEDLWGGAYSSIATYTDTSDDYVYGGSGADHIYGGYAQGGVDSLFGQGGNDLIEASYRKDPNGVSLTKEIIDCGAGASNEVYFDKGVDVVKNCEIEHPYS